MPPLRDRRDDIPLLSGHFLDIAQERLGIGRLRLSVEARKQLREHAWPDVRLRFLACASYERP